MLNFTLKTTLTSIELLFPFKNVQIDEVHVLSFFDMQCNLGYSKYAFWDFENYYV